MAKGMSDLLLSIYFARQQHKNIKE